MWAVLTLPILLANCTSAPKDLHRHSEGELKAKVLVRNLKTKKSQILNVDMKVADPDRLRLDATTTLGIHVFSLVSLGENVEYLVPQQKQHFQGPVSSKVLRPILPISLDPRLLRQIVFQKPLPPKLWKCELDSQGRPSLCTSLKHRLKVTWKSLEDKGVLVDIESAQVARVQINIREFKPISNTTEQVFRLKVPKSYKRRSL